MGTISKIWVNSIISSQLENVYNQFNNLINTLKKEETIDTGEKYPWLNNMDERKYMSDREI